MGASTKIVRDSIAAFALLLSFSCTGKVLPPEGELVLAIESDVPVPADMDSIRVEVRYQGGLLHGIDYALDQHPLPATLGIVRGSANDPVSMRVIGKHGNDAVVVIEARTIVPIGRIAVLPMPLSDSCRAFTKQGPNGPETTCDAGYTCRAGACVSVDVDPSSLPDYTPGQRYPIGDAGTKTDDASVDSGIDAGDPPVQISAGFDHTCLLRASGAVACWGRNQFGQVGDGTLVDRLTPVIVPITGATMLTSAGDHTCVRLLDGTLSCWGNQLGTPVPSPTPVPKIAAVKTLVSGNKHGCVLFDSGAAACSGVNAYGQLGDGTFNDNATPTPISSLPTVLQIAAGGNNSCALLPAGSASCWGDNQWGQIGDGTKITRPSPTTVGGVIGAVEIATGEGHTCVRFASGTMKCWGDDGYGQLGNGEITVQHTSPVDVSGIADAKAIATGGDHTCAIRSGDALACWGWNNKGQLGDGTTTIRSKPTNVPTLGAVIQMSTGDNYTCAILATGGIRCWGENLYGQLGDGTTVERHVPTAVVGY